MGFQDVVFLLSKACFSATFYKNCDRDESLGTTTYFRFLLGVSKGHAPCKMLRFSKDSLSVEFHGDHMTVTKLRCLASDVCL